MRPIPSRRCLYDGRFPLLNVTRCNARLNHPPNSFLPIDRDDFYDSHGPLTIIKPCRCLSFGCCERNATRGERTNPRREKERERERFTFLCTSLNAIEEFTRVSGYTRSYSLCASLRTIYIFLVDVVPSLKLLRKIKNSRF